MADDIWTQLAMDMMGASAAIDASNPYRQAATGINSLTPIATGALATDPKEALAGIALTQLLSGALGGAGNAWTARRVPEYQQTLRAASQGQPLPETQYLSPELFKAAQDKGGLFKLMGQIKAKEDIDKIKAERQSKLYDKLLDYGLTVDDQGKVVDLGVTGLDAIKEAEKKTAVLEAEDAFYNKGIKDLSGNSNTSATLNPNSPQYKAQKDAEDALDKLRTEFQGKDAFKEFEKVDKGYRVLLQAKDDPSAVSDLDFVYGAIQMIEPGMAVKEGEQQAVRGTSSIPDQLKGAMVSAMEGGAKLRPETRSAILDLAARRYGQHADKFNQALDFYQGQAQRRGLPDPSAISYLDRASDPKDIASQFGVTVGDRGGGLDVRGRLTQIRDALKGGKLDDSQKAKLIEEANTLARASSKPTSATGGTQETKNLATKWGY